MAARWIVYAAVCILAAPAAADVVGATNKEVEAVGNPLLEGILKGFADGDYAQYSKDFDETLKESMTEAKFQQTLKWVKDTLGEYRSREYLGFLQKGKMTVILWKAKYEKSEDDVLIKLVASKRGDKNVVTGLWFQ